MLMIRLYLYCEKLNKFTYKLNLVIQIYFMNTGHNFQICLEVHTLNYGFLLQDILEAIIR